MQIIRNGELDNFKNILDFQFKKAIIKSNLKCFFLLIRLAISISNIQKHSIHFSVRVTFSSERQGVEIVASNEANCLIEIVFTIVFRVDFLQYLTRIL